MTIDILYKLLSHISACSVLISLVAGIVKFKTLNAALRVLFIYIIISALTEALSLFLSQGNIKGYYIAQNTFTLLEYLLFSAVFFIEYKNRIAQNLIIAISLIYFIIAIITLSIPGRFSGPNHVISTLQSCILVILSLFFYYKLLTEVTTSKSNDYYFFWVNSAVLLYFSTSFILYLFEGYIEHCEMRIIQTLYSLNLLTNITFNILLAIGIWSYKKK